MSAGVGRLMGELAGKTGVLRWTEKGSSVSPPLVMIHSLGVDSAMWEPQVDSLSAVRRLIQIDLPGHGGSSANPGSYTLSDLGGDVLDVAGAAGADHFDLCGISIGGLLGLWLAIEAPQRVDRLLVANTAARVGTEESWSERMRAVERGGMEGVRHVVAGFFAEGSPQREPKALRHIEEVFVGTDPVGYVGCCAALRDADLRDVVSAIGRPTLIIAGDEDLSTPPLHSEWLHDQIGPSRLAIIPDAAHLSNLDQPELFNDLVLEMLR